MFEAQLYNTITAYTKLFIMSTEDTPTGLRHKPNSDLTSFNQQTKQDCSLLERFFREEQTEYRQQVEGFLPPVKE